MNTRESWIRRSLIFLAGLLCLIAFLELTCRILFASSELDRDVLELPARFESINRDSTQILILGDSRFIAAIDPEHFRYPSFNMSHGSQDMYYHHRLFTKYSPQLPALKTLVLSAGDYIFGFDVAMIDLHRVNAFSRIGIPARQQAHPLIAQIREKSYLWTYRTIVLKRLITLIKEGGFGSKTISMTIDEALRARPENFDAKANGRERARFHMTQCYDASYEEVMMGYLSDILQRARKRGIQVLLVTPPAMETYHNQLTDKFTSRFRELLEQVIKKTGPDMKVTHLDLLKDKRFTSRDFGDVDHLNKDGAAKFTRMINALID